MKKLFIAIMLIVGCAYAAFISSYPNTGTLQGTDLFIIERPGVTNFNVSVAQMPSALGLNSLYDSIGSAHNATNGFPWGSLYDPANAARNATNGFPWGILYDPAGAATAATNNFHDGNGLTNLINSSTVSGVSGVSVALTKNANGSTNYGLTVTAGGSGNVTGSGSSTAGQIAVFNNGTATGISAPGFTTNSWDDFGLAYLVGQAGTNLMNSVSNIVQITTTNIYYVETTGDDTKAVAGFRNRPWKTFTNALAAVVPPAKIHLGYGTFYTSPTTNGSTIPSNVAIDGEGEANTSLVPGNLSQTTTNLNGPYPIGILIGGDNVEMTGLTFGTNTANGTYYLPICLGQGTNAFLHNMRVIGDSDAIYGNVGFSRTMNTNCSGVISDVTVKSGYHGIIMLAGFGATNSNWRIQNSRVRIDGDTNFPAVQDIGIYLGHFTNTIQNCDISVNGPADTLTAGIFVVGSGMTNYLTLANDIFGVTGTSPSWVNLNGSHTVTTIHGLLDPAQMVTNGTINWDAGYGGNIVHVQASNVDNLLIATNLAASEFAVFDANTNLTATLNLRGGTNITFPPPAGHTNFVMELPDGTFTTNDASNYGSGGGSQTPWTSTINAATFGLVNLGTFIQTNAAGMITNGATAVSHDWDTNMVFNWRTNGTSQTSINPATGTLTSKAIIVNGASGSMVVTNAGVASTITSNSVTTGTGTFNGGTSNYFSADTAFLNKIYAVTNAGGVVSVSSGGVHILALNSPWTNDLGGNADIILQLIQTNSASQLSLLAYTNASNGDCLTNSLRAGIAETNFWVLEFPDISPGDTGSFSNYSTVFGDLTITYAKWKLRP